MNVGQKVSRLHLPHRAVWLSLLLILGIVVSRASQIVYADYADGTGQGQYQNQIYWLDWDGFTFADGNTRTFSLPGNVTIVAEVSNMGVDTVNVGRPEDYLPAAFNLAYPNTGHTALKRCQDCTSQFRLTLSATVAGANVPVDMVVADAETADDYREYIRVTTDGNAWQLLEQFQAANLRAEWSDNDKTLLLQGNGLRPFGHARHLAPLAARQAPT